MGICVLVAFSALAHGVVEPWSEAVLEIGAAALLVLWAAVILRDRQAEIRWNLLGWPFLAFGGFGLIQYLARLSVYPYLTKIELLKLAAYVLLFFLTLQAFRTRQEWQGFVWFLLVLGFVLSVFGIIQHFTFNGKLYWFREMRYGGIPFGPYVNRNHFAGFVDLIVPLGLSILLLRAVRRDQLPLVSLFTILPIGALFLAASRGGIMSFLVELGLLAILIWACRGGKPLVGAVAVVVLAGALIAWLGVGGALERFAKFQSLEVSEARRVSMVKDTWRIFLDHPWVGTGLGTLVSVYPPYESVYDGKVVNHAHNDYAEALAETGIVGGLCCLAFVLLLCWSTVVNLRSAYDSLDLAFHVGALVACAGIMVHGLVDFNLRIPSNALLFFLQAVLASTPIPPPKESREALQNSLLTVRGAHLVI